MLGKSIVLLLLTACLHCAAIADTGSFPSFRTEMAPVNGVELYTRIGGKGPPVVLIHGFGDTGDMWAPLAADLAKDHTVIVPDLRGMGLSSIPAAGYDKRNQAADIRALLDRLGVGKADIVGHDIGTMVAYAYAARYPEQTEKLVVMDAPVPGVPPWDDIVRDPKLWHFDFGGPDMERLVRGRERTYLDRFWNEFAGTPSKIDEATRQHYAKLYARPGAMRAAFAQFRSIRQDAVDNKAGLTTKLPMPVLAIGGEQSFGSMEAVVMRNAAVDVTEVVIPHSGHWLMEEASEPTIRAIRTFLDRK
jgi:pimeloyl-ACP methyl ester carboxylesterase